jgi:plastocyanin
LRPRSFIGAGCALLLLVPALAYSQASGTFVAVDNAWQANNQPGETTLRVTVGAKVEFSYPSGAAGNGHNVDFTNQARPDCPGVKDKTQYGVAPWKGTCTFDKVGTYDFICTVHTQENMRGRVIVEAPQATPTPTATADPTPQQPGATATPTPTPTPQVQPQTALAVRVAGAQRGTRVRGRVEVKQRASRLEVTLRRGRTRVGRSTRTVAAAGVVTFSVPLNSTARRTLRRRGRLEVTVAVALTPPGGSKLTRSQRVRLRD